MSDDKTQPKGVTTKADDVTENFIEKDGVGEEKSKKTREDVSKGMPEKEQELLKKVSTPK
ncbi:hypothetical protein [Hasllibacter sp. MH4015]|uniref:hypothetical protein n=1 Tax=Hasllibacter sp. MH4015 TaxID=2854029 RepID=UPI001CD244F8|nr:hypothetical protein [Hasllibacter sp. MH4015]